MSQTYTVKQVAQILGFSTNSIYAFLKAKRIKGVRVGKGRFRIPQTEIDRLLLTAKNPAAKKAVAGITLSPEPETTQPAVLPPVTRTAIRTELPGLLDWAAGLGAILTGISWPLFSPVDLTWISTQIHLLLPAFMMTVLIGAGAGLLVSDIFRKGSGSQKKSGFFRLVLASAFFIVSRLYFVAGLFEGTAAYFLLGITVALSWFLPVFVSYGVSFFQYAVLFTFTVFVFFKTGVIAGILAFAGFFPPVIMALIFAAGLVGLLTLSVSGIRGRRLWWWLSSAFVCGIFFILALVFTRALIWPVALLLLTVAVSGLFIPVWDIFPFRSQTERRTVYFSFGLTLFIFILFIAGVQSLTVTVFDYARLESGRKSAFLAELVETAVTGAVAAVSNCAANPTVIAALDNPKKNSAGGMLRAMFENRDIYRRLVLADGEGNVIASYPLEENAGENIASDRIFSAAVSSLSPVVSGTVVKLTGGRMYLPIAMRIVDPKGKVLGVLVAEYDLTAFSVRLSELTDDLDGEFIAVLDENGHEILYGDIADPGHFETIAGDVAGWLKEGTGEKIRIAPSSRIRYASSVKKMASRPWYIVSGTPLVSLFDRTLVPQLGLGAIFFVSLVFAAFLFITRRIYDRTDHSP